MPEKPWPCWDEGDSHSMRHLIDGTNCLHRLGLTHEDGEQARLAFEARLPGRKGWTIFYDGGPGGRARTISRGFLTIVYSGLQEADDDIVRWLQRNSERPVMVVSDDRRLQSRCRDLGARSRSVADFVQSLRPRAPQTGVVEDQHRKLSADEVAMWQRMFDDPAD